MAAEKPLVRYTKQSEVAFPTKEQTRKAKDPQAIERVQKRQPRRRRAPKSVNLEKLLAPLKENR